MDKAKRIKEKFGSDDTLFSTEKTYILYRKTSFGSISFILYKPDSTQSSNIDNLYDAGNLLQECINGGINNDVSHVRPILTVNVYCDYKSLLKTVIPQLENDSKLNNYFCSNFTSFITNIQRMTIMNATNNGQVEDGNSELLLPLQVSIVHQNASVNVIVTRYCWCYTKYVINC